MTNAQDTTGARQSAAEDFRKPWLIQRLNKPRVVPTGPLAALGSNPFAFGGGLRNGGLSAEAMALLSPHLDFHYMGAAEFEFGEVPRAFGRLTSHAENGDLEASRFSIKLNDVEPDWEDRIRNRRGRASWRKIDGEASVWVLSPPAWHAKIEEWVRADAAGETQLKASSGLSRSLRPRDPNDTWDTQTVGWLELSQGWAFFTDESMFKAIAGLMGLKQG